MKNQTIVKVVIFGLLAIIGMIAIQAYLLMNTWNAEEKEFEDKVITSLRSVSERFEKMGSSPPPTIDLINQLSSNYFVVNINIIIDVDHKIIGGQLIDQVNSRWRGTAHFFKSFRYTSQ